MACKSKLLILLNEYKIYRDELKESEEKTLYNSCFIGILL